MSNGYSESDSYFYDIEGYILNTLDLCSKLGIASRRSFGSTWTIPKEILFETLIEAQVYVDKIAGSTWAQEKWPKRTNRVLVLPKVTGKEDEGIYSGHSHYESGKIFIPDHGHGKSTMMREMWVLHELAHHYAGIEKGEAHGQRFRNALIDLIEYNMDPMFAAFYGICLATGLDNVGE